jgi:hypothetical protein
MTNLEKLKAWQEKEIAQGLNDAKLDKLIKELERAYNDVEDDAERVLEFFELAKNW